MQQKLYETAIERYEDALYALKLDAPELFESSITKATWTLRGKGSSDELERQALRT